jgi:arsenate reductase (glutaredoxin)
MSVSIYHNPDCGTSRNTLAMIRNAGIEPRIVEYLKTPPDRETLKALIVQAGLTVRAALREKGTPYDELGLGDMALSDEQLLDAMLSHPILINRPFVVTPHGVRLCRPSELVLDILPEAGNKPFTKEDGEVVIDREGRRLGKLLKICPTSVPRISIHLICKSSRLASYHDIRRVFCCSMGRCAPHLIAVN